ncbi:MAG TPA: alkaline phosphatase family protein [Chloroflexia bacterium]|nr:alkaline phosphatase family protein [Chloroflexia bacterium]
MKLTLLQRLSLVIALLVFTLLKVPCFATTASPEASPVNHIIVIYLENRSFDNIYGFFPGANGLSNATATATQVDEQGKAYATLPPVMNTNEDPPVIDKRFPANLPNQPFPIDRYVPINEITGDLVHRFYQQQAQINGGKMDGFARISDAGGLTMGYYEGSKLPLWQIAKNYTLADNFFHAAFGGSFLNHFWLVCACTPRYENAPASLVAKLDGQGQLVKDGEITPDGYAVNTIEPLQAPHGAYNHDLSQLLPPQTMPTIGDRLSEKNIDWAWYSGGWNDAIAGKPDDYFQFHHQPFAYFKQYAEGSSQRTQHLKDEKDFLTALQNGSLPPVSFYKPLGEDNEHPGYSNLLQSDQKVATILQKIQQSTVWKDSAVIITYDENGGLWDHVAPPKGDRWGPGLRVPTIIVSPYAKKGFVDHTYYDTTSILKFIEHRYNLQPLGERDARANDLNAAFDYSRPEDRPINPTGQESGIIWWVVSAGVVLAGAITGSAVWLVRVRRSKRKSR